MYVCTVTHVCVKLIIRLRIFNSYILCRYVHRYIGMLDMYKYIYVTTCNVFVCVEYRGNYIASYMF